MAFNIIGATLSGDVFFDWSDAAAYEELMMIVAKDGCFWASYAVPPFWKPGYRRYRTLCAKLKILTEGIIRKCIDQNSALRHTSLSSSAGVVKDPVKSFLFESWILVKLVIHLRGNSPIVKCKMDAYPGSHAYPVKERVLLNGFSNAAKLD
ncbi:Cytochrome P450 78A3 [Hordeum vulgare]|nr:Cytochrome P450 78A3 [Hordeum vulgare]